ncbi:serine/threonine protein kinase [Enhygromyxa salina]|uniref:serine/threonine protein kinase n=1 Tax=Enhygromyxa salina TaxID=215803 RepID=UPI000D04498D|nr:serine/threonine-protein kinase [Enhygromyxa salina]
MALTDALGETQAGPEDDLERSVLESETISGGGAPDSLISAMTQTIAPTMALQDRQAANPDEGAKPLVVQRSAEPDDRAGDIIRERFELVRMLGKGGMGTVYVARHTTLPKTFAVKVLNRRYAQRKDIAERFLQEARAVSLIDHENVVGVVDFGKEADGSAYLVMEHLRGESLSAICKREAPLAWPRIAHIMSQLCRALQAAHDVGIIHRDVKPENVLRVGRHEDPDYIKVLDFGLAKMQVSGGLRLTRTGMVLGTPDYMSPEQARGRPTDHRADIYAAGIMMYELLCGRVPFKADTFPAMRQKHLLEPPEPPSRWAPEAGISDEMDAIVLRALAKDPDHRFASMTQMEQAIAAVGTGAPVELLERHTMPLLTERTLLDGPGRAGMSPAERAGPRGSTLPIGPTLPIGATLPIAATLPVGAKLPSAAEPTTSESSARSPARVLAIWFVAVVAVIALTYAAVLLGGRLGPDEVPGVAPAEAPRAQREPSVATPIQPAVASLRFHTNVPVTLLDARGQPIASEPVSGESGIVTQTAVPIGDVAIELVLRAEGHEDLHVVVTPTRDRDLEFVLEPAPAAPAEPAPEPERPEAKPKPSKPKPKQEPKPEPKPVVEPKPEPKTEPKPGDDHSFAPEIVDPFGAPKRP